MRWETLLQSMIDSDRPALSLRTAAPADRYAACPPLLIFIQQSSAAAEGSWSHFTRRQRFLLSQRSLYEIIMRKEVAFTLKLNKFTSVRFMLLLRADRFHTKLVSFKMKSSPMNADVLSKQSHFCTLVIILSAPYLLQHRSIFCQRNKYFFGNESLRT